MQGSALGGGIGATMHLTKGSPVNPEGQVQMGLWISTAHWALIPQVPGQGSWHCWLIHAKLRGQSSCLIHSGLHPEGSKGLPIIPGIHEQRACRPSTTQKVFLPHGEGLQGSVGIEGGKHPVKGFPMNPGRHWQFSPRVVTIQSALIPQGPGTQSCTMSGSHPGNGGGAGRNPGRHKHWGLPPYVSRHSVLGPHT